MTLRDYARDELTWRIPLSGATEHPYLPLAWLAAVTAVGHDLRFRRYGRRCRLDDASVAWDLTLVVHGDSDFVNIGMSPTTTCADGFGGFSVGRGYILTATAAQATLWVAEAVQDDLAGYEFVQWPSNGGRLFAPEVRDERAVWVHPDDSTTIPIGGLTAAE
ncbi:hypothetical protein [Williamsia maris]|uniref:Uncharacterized protein n=1 Tax=Williamsia maris TaxID=72806 RepID=A0ABT1HIX6_9NOCA|nr:hypothetical protein [Williamsia maris]MCP2177890.1 hypothetical protein [Williamsia maris]